MTDEQAIESCRRAKSVCALAIADARKTILHYCNDDPVLTDLLNSLQIFINSHLDQEARSVFIENRKQ